MTRNKIIPYRSDLKLLARKLRANSTKSEIYLWMSIKNKSLGYQFHRQVPIDEYIVDFYCHELKLAIEVDGYTHDYNFQQDEFRQSKLQNAGIRVVRFSDEDIIKHKNDVIRALQIIITEIEGKSL